MIVSLGISQEDCRERTGVGALTERYCGRFGQALAGGPAPARPPLRGFGGDGTKVPPLAGELRSGFRYEVTVRRLAAAGAHGRRMQTAVADHFAAGLLPLVRAIQNTGANSLEAITRALNERGVRPARDTR